MANCLACGREFYGVGGFCPPCRDKAIERRAEASRESLSATDVLTRIPSAAPALKPEGELPPVESSYVFGYIDGGLCILIGINSLVAYLKLAASINSDGAPGQLFIALFYAVSGFGVLIRTRFGRIMAYIRFGLQGLFALIAALVMPFSDFGPEEGGLKVILTISAILFLMWAVLGIVYYYRRRDEF